MWTRKELKQKGKAAFLANYWKTVLVSLIVVILLAGTGGAGGRAGGTYKPSDEDVQFETQIPGVSGVASIPQQIESAKDALNEAASAAGAGIVAGIIGIIVLAVSLIAICVDIFLLNPLSVGATRFFVKNLNTKAQIRELGFCFDSGYRYVVKTMFFKDLYNFLWYLLLIIPGIVKAYEYRMIPYILSEHPDMPTQEVFRKSKEMMSGQKWNTFVLDLSFIGWEIVSLITSGIVGIFYVNPYRHMTSAALYERLEYGNGTGSASAYGTADTAYTQNF